MEYTQCQHDVVHFHLLIYVEKHKHLRHRSTKYDNSVLYDVDINIHSCLLSVYYTGCVKCH